MCLAYNSVLLPDLAQLIRVPFPTYTLDRRNGGYLYYRSFGSRDFPSNSNSVWYRSVGDKAR